MCSGDEAGRLDNFDPLGNWRGPAPVRRKLRQFVRNNLVKVRKRSSCCGNHGEPGC